MKPNQIYQVLNLVNKQMWGKEAVQVTDLAGLISLGETLSLSEADSDAYLGALVDRIGKTRIRRLDVVLKYPNLFRDSFTFGAMLQKINVNPFDAIQNSDYEVGSAGFTPTLTDVHKPSINVDYFKGSDSWAFRVSVPSDLFYTAFNSAADMSNFIDAIYEALTESMTMSINNMCQTAINNFIAEKIKVGNGVVNLLSLFNATQETPIEASAAITNKDFLRFAGMVLRNYIGYMEEPTSMYNTAGRLRATRRDNLNAYILRDFASAYTTYYSSDTFHQELAKLPGYKEVVAWQGSNSESGGDLTNTPTFETNSTINVIPSSEKSVEAAQRTPINQTGVVAAFIDREGIAIGIDKRRVGKFYNPMDDYVNTKTSANLQFINDITENGVIFIIADAS